MSDKTNECWGRSPSPLNGERAGVRGESVERVSIPQALAEVCPLSPHPTLSPPSGSGEGMEAPAFSLIRGPSSNLAIGPNFGVHFRLHGFLISSLASFTSAWTTIQSIQSAPMSPLASLGSFFSWNSTALASDARAWSGCCI